MIQKIIDYLNLRLPDYFEEKYCLAERIEREGKIYPAVYFNNEYKTVLLDQKGSCSYWRKVSDVSYSESENTTQIGNQYSVSIPLRLVCFLKKDNALNDAYFSERVVQEIIGMLTTNSVYLKQQLKAKKISISATRTQTDGRILAQDEYSEVNFEPRYDFAMFSIDFNVAVTTNENCFEDICGSVQELKCGSVRIVDQNGDLIATVDCGDTYECSSTGDPATVHNSDDTFETTVACGGDLELDDITFNIFVNGTLNQSVSAPSQVNHTLNINA